MVSTSGNFDLRDMFSDDELDPHGSERDAFPYDMKAVEDVYFTVIEDPSQGTQRWHWKGLAIDDIATDNARDAKTDKPLSDGTGGPASYERCENGFLDHTILGMCPDPGSPGTYVMIGFGADYTTDDYGDVDVYHGFDLMRPATYREIRDVFGFSRWVAFKEVWTMWRNRKVIRARLKV